MLHIGLAIALLVLCGSYKDYPTLSKRTGIKAITVILTVLTGIKAIAVLFGVIPSYYATESSSFFPGRPARSDRVRNQSKSVAGLASCFEVRTAYQIVKEKMMIVLIGGKI